MDHDTQTLFIGETPLKRNDDPVRGSFVTLMGEPFYKIENYDLLEPFFMSLVSSSDHWLFIASTGGLSAGRGSADHALFPYYTEDKLTENSENTGSKAILLVTRSDRRSLWEPFSNQQQGAYSIQRNLYKNMTGTALVFEEANLDLGLAYRYAWRTSGRFGFIRTTWLTNLADSPCQVALVDGLQNLLPANVATETQNGLSCLLDAYKRSELEPAAGLGIFALNAMLTDLAEPKESLLATTVAQIGLAPTGYLLSSTQLGRFRAGCSVVTETEVRGRRGAYFVHAALDLAPGEARVWHLIADVDQDSAAVAEKLRWLQGDRAALAKAIEEDVTANASALWTIVASADGVQISNGALYPAHHFANVLFNVMRGGVFADQYSFRAADFVDFVSTRNRAVLQAHSAFFSALPARMDVSELQTRAAASDSADLVRLSCSFLPLIFSRRHGDPSRPWNRFSIDIKKADGTAKLGYEGNWRDIFQNWEVLAYSYPEFVESMIATFLNATTADGYNPYRITYNGIDWEAPEPDNPWANIGYWSDHQIIYLQKLMEISARVHPGRLQGYLTERRFSYANVPYRIKPYSDLLRDPYNTIVFDWDLQRQIADHQKQLGSDAKLLLAPEGQILVVSLAEKLLTLLLAKLANFVPEGGIWMNTQRPEWNDANNALVGKGLSVVTLCYLRRYILFYRQLLSVSGLDAVPLSREVHRYFQTVAEALRSFQGALDSTIDDHQRRRIMDALGEAGSAYRWNVYHTGFAGEVENASVMDIVAFLDLTQRYVEHTLRANRRSDNLYHAYNVLHIGDESASVGHLYEMLEGQVAILSSGLLTGEESVNLLESLRESALYQPEQHSYILYPERNLPGFVEKNRLSREQIAGVRILEMLVEAQEPTIITRDLNGVYHFSGQLHNFRDVQRALDALSAHPQYAELIAQETEKIRALFESTFHHAEFTGRSGTFFAYEGLGSIYWHMVAKLLLAVQETAFRLEDDPAVSKLLVHYADVRRGLGFNKQPDSFGAFPTDPYSHTPKGRGAKQPGMTGLVKEEILTRYGEVGFFIEDGALVFDPLLLDRQEFLDEPSIFGYLDVAGRRQHLDLTPGSLAYTICQTPVVLEASNTEGMAVHFADGRVQQLDGHVLDAAFSRHIFARDGQISRLTVRVRLGG
ncbi:MAG: hypothetical protein JNL42_18775 [Anaerolineae bacterium]|nr:hypothetical protein [Anaerolineae bacterium]